MKTYKTTLVIEFIHDGKFNPHEPALIQTPGGLPYFGDYNNQENDPQIIKVKNRSRPLTKAQTKRIRGE